MKHKILLVLSCLLVLSACTADGKNESPDSQKEEPAPAGSPNGYVEHLIFNDRYSTIKEIVYVSPVDGKTIICTAYGTGVGAGTSCRVKEPA